MKDGSSVFDWAVFGGNLSVMAYFKDEVPGLDVHSTNISGCTAAHWVGEISRSAAAGRQIGVCVCVCGSSAPLLHLMLLLQGVLQEFAMCRR
jgi:hypothetical protein